MEQFYANSNRHNNNLVDGGAQQPYEMTMDEEVIGGSSTACFPEAPRECPVSHQVAEMASQTMKQGSSGPNGVCPFSLQVSCERCLTLRVAHTDPSLDYFEVGWPLKYKMRYSHYMNQRVFYKVDPTSATTGPVYNTTSYLAEESKHMNDDQDIGPATTQNALLLEDHNQGSKVAQEE